MPDARDPRYFAFKRAAAVSGRVVEVGLGRGDLARNLLEEPRITSVTNYERDPAVVADFDSRVPVRDPRHTIIEAEFITAPLPVVPFDTGIIDTMEALEQTYYDDAWVYARQLQRRMVSGGHIIMQWIGDVPMERELRERMARRFGPMQLEFVNTGIMRTTRHIAYYIVP